MSTHQELIDYYLTAADQKLRDNHKGLVRGVEEAFGEPIGKFKLDTHYLTFKDEHGIDVDGVFYYLDYYTVPTSVRCVVWCPYCAKEFGRTCVNKASVGCILYERQQHRCIPKLIVKLFKR